jgi:hypothetical protein
LKEAVKPSNGCSGTGIFRAQVFWRHGWLPASQTTVIGDFRTDGALQLSGQLAARNRL